MNTMIDYNEYSQKTDEVYNLKLRHKTNGYVTLDD